MAEKLLRDSIGIQFITFIKIYKLYNIFDYYCVFDIIKN